MQGMQDRAENKRKPSVPELLKEMGIEVPDNASDFLIVPMLEGFGGQPFGGENEPRTLSYKYLPEGSTEFSKVSVRIEKNKAAELIQNGVPEKYDVPGLKTFENVINEPVASLPPERRSLLKKITKALGR
jgi:hypothetical protein